MPNIGPVELVIILVIALLILGPGKLPDVGAALGKSIKEFRKASSDVQEAVKVDTSPMPATPAPAATPVPPVEPVAPVAEQPVAPAAAAPVDAAAPTPVVAAPAVEVSTATTPASEPTPHAS